MPDRATEEPGSHANKNGDPCRIAIVQLSDIHLQASNNPVVPRGDKIVAAIRPVLQDVQGLVFAVTGDVAYSGSSEEYEIAFAFFSEIRDSINKIDPSISVDFVAIPGNHDCCFKSQDDLRPALLENLASKIEDLDPCGKIVRQMTEVQNNFFSFYARLTAAEDIPVADRLRYRKRVPLGGTFSIVFDCYNTAWMSQKDEQQGDLLFPNRLLVPETIGEEDHLSISLLHHRDNWLEANNARLLRDYVETYSDIILTGHEHVGAAYTKATIDGLKAQYVEGAVLQDSKNPGNSGFSVLEFDLRDGLQKTLRFRWSGQRYSQEGTDQWSKFGRNAASAQGRFQIAPSFLKALRDPGTGFIHPAKPDLTLDDLFVYPDLRRTSLRKLVKSDSSATVVAGRDVVRFIADSKHVMISGPDDSGRTSLAHMLFLDLRQREHVVPVLLNGEDIQGKNPEATLRREVKRAVEEQYSGSMAEAYEQLERGRKLVIVDDWHKLKYSAKGQALLIGQLEKSFGTIVCLADDVFALGQLTGTGEKPFRDYEICDIRELGHLRRNELIRKWHSLGSDYSESETDLAHAITVTETTVNTLLGKNLLPSFPVIILAILQSYAANRAPSSSAGSYGQMYEALITTALASVSKKAVELGTKYTYISRMAHYVLETNKHELEAADLQTIHNQYYEQYKINLAREELIDQLVRAQILSRANGTVGFNTNTFTVTLLRSISKTTSQTGWARETLGGNSRISPTRYSLRITPISLSSMCT
jgi:Calcineurin-like phosphoesterase